MAHVVDVNVPVRSEVENDISSPLGSLCPNVAVQVVDCDVVSVVGEHDTDVVDAMDGL